MVRSLGLASEVAGNDAQKPASGYEDWRMLPYAFKPLKHNPVVAAVARQVLGLMTRGLEKVIFTATTGRSGTLTLTKLFSAIPGCVAVHEGHPIMNGPVLEAASYGNTALGNRVYRQIKSVNIRRAAVGRRYYVEANHLFIKTFCQQAIDDFGKRVAVIHLVRPAVEVATSIYCLQDYPGTERGNYWWLDYRAPANLIQITDILDSDAEFSHPFYKALWYWHEIEARISAWRVSMPGVDMVRFETDWLGDKIKVFELLDRLGIRYERSRLETMVGGKEHTKDHQKTGHALPNGKAGEMAARFQQLLARLGLGRHLELPGPSIPPALDQ
jgi:hypothetical protein